MKRLIKQIIPSILIALSPILSPLSKILAAPMQPLYGGPIEMMPVMYGPPVDPVNDFLQNNTVLVLGALCCTVLFPVLIIVGVVVYIKKKKKPGK
jgi:hypothetical protein